MRHFSNLATCFTRIIYFVRLLLRLSLVGASVCFVVDSGSFKLLRLGQACVNLQAKFSSPRDKLATIWEISVEQKRED